MISSRVSEPARPSRKPFNQMQKSAADIGMASAPRCGHGCRRRLAFVRHPSWVGRGRRRRWFGHWHVRRRLFLSQRRDFMPKNQLQMSRDNGGLVGANGTSVVAQLEKTLKPKTEISTL